jgi:hypothetical protein
MLEEPERLLARLPEVKLARALACEAEIAVIEIKLDHLKNSITLEVVKAGPSLLSFSQVDHLRDRGVSGELELEKRSDTETRVNLHLNLPTRLFGWKRSSALRNTLAAAITRLSEVDKPHLSTARGGNDLVKLLEVTRRGGVIEVWLRGKSYSVVPTEIQ